MKYKRNSLKHFQGGTGWVILVIRIYWETPGRVLNIFARMIPGRTFGAISESKSGWILE